MEITIANLEIELTCTICLLVGALKGQIQQVAFVRRFKGLIVMLAFYKIANGYQFWIVLRRKRIFKTLKIELHKFNQILTNKFNREFIIVPFFFTFMSHILILFYSFIFLQFHFRALLKKVLEQIIRYNNFV